MEEHRDVPREQTPLFSRERKCLKRKQVDKVVDGVFELALQSELNRWFPVFVPWVREVTIPTRCVLERRATVWRLTFLVTPETPGARDRVIIGEVLEEFVGHRMRQHLNCGSAQESDGAPIFIGVR